MSVKEIFGGLRRFLNPQNLIIMLAVSAFAPLSFTAVAIIAAAIMILITPEYQRGLFNFRGALLIPIFCAYAFAVAFFSNNKLGMAVAPVFFILFIIFCFVRNFITKETFETCLTGVCLMVIPATIYAFSEILISQSDNGLVYRCAAYFFNANYFGALMAAVIIICAYRIVDSKGRAFFYYFIALLALINIYLSASLFALIEIVAGVAAYLLFSKHYRLFCLMVICGSLGVILITTIPQLIPRLAEASSTTEYRVRIWGVAIREISANPLFGKGFMGYFSTFQNYVGSYDTQHCHNVFLDCLLNFGVVGCIILLLLGYFIACRIVRCYKADKASPITAIIIAILVAVISHSFTDITFFWIQTGLFYCIIMGSIGAEERRLGIPDNTLIRGKHRI